MNHTIAAMSALALGMLCAASGPARAEPPAAAPPAGGGAAPGTEAAAASLPAATLTLDDVVEAARTHNPRLRALRATWEATRERPLQARTLPNPEVLYRGMDVTGGYRFPDTEEKRFEIEQTFPWFGKLGLRGKVAEKAAEAAGFELEATAREVIMQVKESYFELYAVQHALAITRAEEDVLRRIQRISETKYATGEASQQDVLKAQAELSMLKARILELEQQETVAQARLNQLLDRRADAPLGRAVTAPGGGSEATLEELFALALDSRPEIKASAAEIERSRHARELVRKDFFPDYRLGLEYRRFTSSEDMVMFTVGIDLPIWIPKYRAGVREAERMVAAGTATREAAERQTAFDVRDAHFKLDTARRTVALYAQALVPQAEARFRASEAGYRTGSVDFLDLLESERFLLEARVMHAMAEGALGTQLARLERAVGRDLPHTGAPAATGK